jgi:hypothetical protein
MRPNPSIERTATAYRKDKKGISPILENSGRFRRDMPRVARIAPGGFIFHVLNRGNARCRIFEDDRDYEALERVIIETADRIAIRILA